MIPTVLLKDTADFFACVQAFNTQASERGWAVNHRSLSDGPKRQDKTQLQTSGCKQTAPADCRADPVDDGHFSSPPSMGVAWDGHNYCFLMAN